MWAAQDADDYSKDYVERDERRLTELGRRAVEMFAAAHIFAALQEAHSEAESIKRQDALIQEVCAARTQKHSQKSKLAQGESALGSGSVEWKRPRGPL